MVIVSGYDGSVIMVMVINFFCLLILLVVVIVIVIVGFYCIYGWYFFDFVVNGVIVVSN